MVFQTHYNNFNVDQFNFLKVTADMSGVPGGAVDQTVYVPSYWNT